MSSPLSGDPVSGLIVRGMTLDFRLVVETGEFVYELEIFYDTQDTAEPIHSLTFFLGYPLMLEIRDRLNEMLLSES